MATTRPPRIDRPPLLAHVVTVQGRADSAPLRAAFRRRAEHAVDLIAASATPEALARALEAPTDFGALASALGDTVLAGPALDLDPLADALARTPRALIGYSDVTALHAAVAARVPGLVTFHGPTARAPLPAFSRASLERAVGAAPADPCGDAPGATPLRPGRARGRLAGGAHA